MEDIDVWNFRPKWFTWRHFRQSRKNFGFGSALFTQFWRCKYSFVYYSNVQRTFKDAKIKSTVFTRRHAMKRHKSIGPGAFHDRSTTGWHHHIFYFDEILYTGLSGALKLILTIPDPWGQQFQSYSLGQFREVTPQDNLWVPIAPKPMHIIHQICIMYINAIAMTQGTCLLSSLKKCNFWWHHIFFFFLCIPLSPKKVLIFNCILKFDHLSWADKNWRGVLSKNILIIFLKTSLFCQCSIARRLP